MGVSTIKRILLVLCGILFILVGYLYVDIWFYVQAQPPPTASTPAPPLVSDQELPIWPDLEFQSNVRTRSVYTYEQMVEDIRALLEQYPLLQADIIGRSVEGRAIYQLKLGRGPVKILLDGSHHASEWIGSFLLMTMVEHYAHYYHTGNMFDQYDLRQIGERVTFYFVPMVNPDGVEIVASRGESSLDYQRLLTMNGGSKNFTRWKANARGVDLNRQYPANWAYAESYGPSRPAAANYAGPQALSEPEIVAMHELYQAEQFQAQVSFHTVGNLVYYYYHQTGDDLKRDRALADLVSRATGYPVRDSSGGIGGLAKDYAISTYHIPSLIIELGRNKSRPLPEFTDMWRRNRQVPLVIAEFLKEAKP